MDWIIPVITVVGSVGGAYLGVRVAVADLTARMRSIEMELGSHDTGLRGAVHRHTNDIVRLNGCYDSLEERVTNLENPKSTRRR